MTEEVSPKKKWRQSPNLTKMSVPKTLRDEIKDIADKQSMTMVSLLRIWAQKHHVMQKSKAK